MTDESNTYIERAVAHFRALLEEQLEPRRRAWNNGSPAKDFANAWSSIVIGVIGGDGIGPIIMAAGRGGCWKTCWRTRLPSGRVELRAHRGADH